MNIWKGENIVFYIKNKSEYRFYFLLKLFLNIDRVEEGKFFFYDYMFMERE